MPSNTSTGLAENLEGALCYLLGVITGILFLVVEKKSSFVRFHAMQSLAIFVTLFVLMSVNSMIPFVGWLIGLLLVPLTFVLWLILMVAAYQGKRFKLPIVGDFAEQHANI